jgi:hypothetical protein
MSQLNVARVILTNGLKLPEYSTVSLPPGEFGLLNFDTSSNTIKIQDGTQWKSINSSGSVKATGGTVSDVGNYRIHTFTGSGTFSVTSPGPVEYLIVAGGGGGGSGRHCGGAGGGGVLYGSFMAYSSSYSVIVGSGGTAAPANGLGAVGFSANGGNSSVFGLTAIGGGAGGGHPYTDTSDPIRERGRNGGSGGGGAHGNSAGGQIPGLRTIGQGNNGTPAPNRSQCGGGGGAGGSSQFGSGGETGPGNGCSGGIGILISINGTPLYWAGGGGGSGSPQTPSDLFNGGNGGLGGGGGGASSSSNASAVAGSGGGSALNSGQTGVKTATTGICDGGNGGANTGGGGGAAGGWGSFGNGKGGNGGSGIVIIRYLI